MENTDADNKKNKKELITEKITGRRLTPGRVLKMIFVALICGAAFAVAATTTAYFIVPYLRQMLEEEQITGVEDSLQSTTESESPQAEAESTGERGETARADETESSESLDETPEETGEAPSAATEDPSESTGSLQTESSEASGTLESAEDPGVIAETIDQRRRSDVENVSRYIVRVDCISTGTTWFDTEASSSVEYSAVIIEVGEDEILVLTTDATVDYESLRVRFYNGYTADAYVKQTSTHDDLAVLAVASHEEGEEDLLPELADIEAVEFGDEEEIYAGRPVIACGAPLGTAGSYAFGDIGYIQSSVSGLDEELSMFYVDISVDAQKGTFIMTGSGTVLGMAVDENEDEETGSLYEGASAVISAASLADTVERLLAGEKIAFIGVEGTEVSFDMRYYGMPDGVYVTAVELSGPAAAAGVLRGDIISSIDAAEVTDMDELKAEIRSHLPGDEITIAVMRSAGEESYEELEFACTLGER